jgi:hypothetical protein
MHPTTTAAIQRAGQAIQEAHLALVNETNACAAQVAQALDGDAFNLDNDARFEQWKTVARMAQTLEAMNEQLKQLYLAAGDVAMGASSSTSTKRLRLAPAREVATDVVEVAVSKKAPRKNARKQGRAKSKPASAPASTRSAVAASGLKGNAGRVLDFLLTKLDKEQFARVTHAEISEGAPVPLGSVGAAIVGLAKGGHLEEGDRGSYRLL